MDKHFEEFSQKCERVPDENQLLTDTNERLKAVNESLSLKISVLEQYPRLNNIEVRGIAITKDECCYSIIKNLGAHIGYPIEDRDLNIAH